MLRDPKDVATDLYCESKRGAWFHVEDTLLEMIRARDREVIAEAKRVVRREIPTGSASTIETRAMNALDAILKEKE